MRRRYRIDAAGNLVEIPLTDELLYISVCHVRYLEELVPELPVELFVVMPVFSGLVLVSMPPQLIQRPLEYIFLDALQIFVNNQLAQSFDRAMHPCYHVVDLAEHIPVEPRVPELGSGESDHPGATEAIENLEHVLVDIAKRGNKDDFYFLARANGVIDEELDELWQGTRRRLKLAL